MSPSFLGQTTKPADSVPQSIYPVAQFTTMYRKAPDRISLKEAVRSQYECKLPVFLLGPIAIRGHAANGRFRVPFLTTEAVLPQSVQRGIQAMNLSESCRVRLTADGMTRSPVFKA